MMLLFSLGTLGGLELLLIVLAILLLFGSKWIFSASRAVARFPLEVLRGKKGEDGACPKPDGKKA